MRKIHIFSKNNRLHDQLTDLESEIHYSESWEQAALDLATHNPENLVLLDWEYAVSLSGKIQAPVCLLANFDLISETELGLLRELSRTDLRVSALLDTSKEMTFSLPILRSLSMSAGANWRHLGEDLGHFVGYTLAELQRIKKLHEQIVPMRSEDIKGLKVLSKFAAGESAGGEFFDIIRGDQEFILLLTSSRSYVISSMILSHFESLRDKKHFRKDDLLEFLSSLSNEILSNGNFGEKDLELFLGRVDLKKMKMEGYHFGQTALVSSSSSHIFGNNLPISQPFFEQAFFNLKLNRGEKIVLLSPGVRLNCNDILAGQDLFSFTKGLFERGPKSLVNEIFYQLKKDVKGDFLVHDASSIYLEVDSNVILQV
jgi:hypothetical protein